VLTWDPSEFQGICLRMRTKIEERVKEEMIAKTNEQDEAREEKRKEAEGNWSGKRTRESPCQCQWRELPMKSMSPVVEQEELQEEELQGEEEEEEVVVESEQREEEGVEEQEEEEVGKILNPNWKMTVAVLEVIYLRWRLGKAQILRWDWQWMVLTLEEAEEVLAVEGEPLEEVVVVVVEDEVVEQQQEEQVVESSQELELELESLEMRDIPLSMGLPLFQQMR
jgi:hypothetical protein